ncbi:MAG: cobalamin-dependent protein [Candidatus Diapherotrites archaeon]|uniref:Cobalamin-dependent protein n=1 Tax=Candidatus Iainarchaeum sp. TaxID=3101447 RepID=A0A8T4KUW6_9ARCH|nr:cobalamin-dependent protein [Candidatus Diapherotrites archaeon]
MNVLFATSWKTPHTSPPLGVGYLASYLRENGMEVGLLDYNFSTDFEDVRKKLEESNAELVAVSAMSSTFSTAKKIAEIARKELDCPIALGGAHASIMPVESLKDSAFDIAVVGEGERTSLELAKAVSAGKSLSKVRGIYYKKGRSVKKNPPMPYIENLDELPFPARDLMEMKKYLVTPEEFPMLMPQTGLVAIRGCPFQCTYCQPTSMMMFGLKTRYRSPKSIVDEMELIRDAYKLESIKVGGDTLTARHDWIMELCKEIKDRKIDTLWIAGTRVNTVDDERLKAMKEAGCYFIQFGVESGSPRVLKEVMNKGITVEQTRKAFALCKKHGIITGANIMLGSPTESRREIEMSIRLIKEISPDMTSGYITNPLPGTYLYDQALEKSLITECDLELIDRHGLGTMKRDITDEELLLYLRKLWLVSKSEKVLNYLLPWRKPYYLSVALKRSLNLLQHDRKTLLSDFKTHALTPFALLKASIQVSRIPKNPSA